MNRHLILAALLALAACGEAGPFSGFAADSPSGYEGEPGDSLPDAATPEITEVLNPGKPEPQKQEEDEEETEELTKGGAEESVLELSSKPAYEGYGDELNYENEGMNMPETLPHHPVNRL